MRTGRGRAALVIATTALVLLAGEVSLRTFLFIGGIPPLADPGLYADPLCDNDYWRLRVQATGWTGPRATVTASEWDPVIGWTPDRRNLDRWGAWPTVGAPAQPAGQPTALLGSSFMFGTTPDGERISDFLQAQLSDRQVHNYAVGGYGIDQMVMAAQRHLSQRESVQVIVGIMTTDLDRSVLQVRTAPKPWATIQGSAAQLHRPVAPDGPSAWFDNHPPQIGSYLAAFTGRVLKLHLASLQGHLEPPCKVDEKTALNLALLAKFQSMCRQHNHTCRLALFHRVEELDRAPDWRTHLVRQASQDLELPLIDTADIIRKAAMEAGVSARSMYGEDRHPTAQANAAFATAFAQALGHD